MYTVIWTIKPNEGTSREDILLELRASKADYERAEGLLDAVFGLAADTKAVLEISTWKSRAHAERHFTASWETKLSRRWQAAPAERSDWDTPIAVRRVGEPA